MSDELNKLQRTRRAARTHQRGVGLIEIVVAVLLLSIGMLAAGRMQLQSMQANRGAYYQSQAYLLTNDIVDRMRTNGAGILTGEYDGMQTSAEATDPGCAAKFCNSGELALQDLYDWSARFHSLGGTTGFVPTLPGTGENVPVGSIAALGDDAYSVTVTWSEPVDGVETTQTYSIQFTALVPQ